MWPILVAVERSRWFLINVVVRPGMMASSSLRSSAQRSVDAGREHMICWMLQEYLAVEDVASTLAANVAVGGVIRGAWLGVADGLAAWSLVFLVRGRMMVWPR